MPELTQLTGVLDALNISITNKYVLLILIIFFSAMLIKAIRDIFEGLQKPLKYLKNKLYDIETKQFIFFRSSFIINLKNDVIRLNDSANWSDFYYTDLEAEVEVDPAVDLVWQSQNKLDILTAKIQYISNILKGLFGLSGKNKVEKNLINAILNSRSHSFLIIGDPGSGKTVSLRHLFIKLADKALSSKDKNTVVPIYLNLKHLNIGPEALSDEKIREWIIGELRAGKARGIYDFIDINFERMLGEGNFFFFFDSFDEIPAILDQQEDKDIVQTYAKVLDGFIHSYKCKGLVSSRPYRSPKIFIGQRMTIRPLSNKLIKKALYNYFIQQPMLSEETWQQLSASRIDLLHFASNPFYLGLLVGYIRINKKLPDRHYELFENFVKTRTITDEARLEQFGLSPQQLIKEASKLAFAMTKAKNIGLEADVEKILIAINDVSEEDKWNDNNLDSLLNALSFSMFGKLSDKEIGNTRVFTFVHRRFQEYFAARFVQEHHESMPIDDLVADNRWREILVLLCEVLEIKDLQSIFEFIRTNLSKGIDGKSGSTEHRKALEIIRFLRDGFRSRIGVVPEDIRNYCSLFIRNQLLQGTRLDQKRAIESISIADDNSIHILFEETFKQESDWLWETAIRSCRTLQSISKPISESILKFLYFKYITINYYDYYLYSFLFTSTVLTHFKNYLNIIILLGMSQLLLYILIILFELYNNIYTCLYLIIVIIATYMIFRLKEFTDTGHWHLDVKFASVLVNFWTVTAFSFAIIFNNTLNINHIFLSLFGGILIMNLLIFGLISVYPFSWKGLISIPSELMKLIKSIPLELIKLIKSKDFISKLIRKHSKFFISYFLAVYILSKYGGDILSSLRNTIRIVIENNYNIINIYYNYDIYQFVCVIALASIFLLFVIFGVVSFFKDLYRIAKKVIFYTIDSIKLRQLDLIANHRPQTTIEVIVILNDLKSDLSKIQYLRTLHKWIQNGDKELLEEEAKKHDGRVRDEIYKVIEFWDDSNK